MKTTQPKKKKWKTTKEMRYLNEKVNQLQKAYPEIMTRSFWQRRVSIEDKLLFLRELARAKSELWNCVYTTYPDTVGKSLRCSEKHIIELI